MLIAEFLCEMNFNDLLIIYLTCGAPFGVYYFLQNRRLRHSKVFWFRMLAGFVFWIPIALSLVARKYSLTNLYNGVFVKNAISDSGLEVKITAFQKEFEQFFKQNQLSISIFEFREIVQRYTGLSLEIQNMRDEDNIIPKANGIFNISDHPNKKLAEICLQRRNRKRLLFHQTLARKDFFELFEQLVKSPENPRNMFKEATDYFLLLNDLDAVRMLDKLIEKTLQTQAQKIVKYPEKDLWINEQQQFFPAQTITTNMQVLTAKANLSNKD